MPPQQKNSNSGKKGIVRKAVETVKGKIAKVKVQRTTKARNADQKLALKYANGDATAADVIATKSKKKNTKKTN